MLYYSRNLFNSFVSRFQAKVMGPGKKRGTSTTQILRKSQRNQEEGGSSNGATSTLPGQPLANHGQVMSVVAANDQHAGVPTTPNCLGECVCSIYLISC